MCRNPESLSSSPEVSASQIISLQESLRGSIGLKGSVAVGVLARQARGSCQDTVLVLSRWLNVVDGGPGAEAPTPSPPPSPVMPVRPL